MSIYLRDTTLGALRRFLLIVDCEVRRDATGCDRNALDMPNIRDAGIRLSTLPIQFTHH